MATEAYSAEEAKKAFQEAIELLEDLSKSFNTQNENFESVVGSKLNLDSGKVALSGQLARAASGSYQQNTIETFNNLISQTKSFNENRVEAIMKNSETFSSNATSTFYSNN